MYCYAVMKSDIPLNIVNHRDTLNIVAIVTSSEICCYTLLCSRDRLHCKVAEAETRDIHCNNEQRYIDT